jgi:hypothetical protein
VRARHIASYGRQAARIRTRSETLPHSRPLNGPSEVPPRGVTSHHGAAAKWPSRQTERAEGRLVVLGTRLNPLSVQGIVARGFRNRGGSLSRRSRPDSASEGESEAKREGRKMAIARFYRAIRARGIRNRHSLAKHVVLGTSDGPAGAVEARGIRNLW